MSITMAEIVDAATAPADDLGREDLLAIIADLRAMVEERWSDTSLLKSTVDDRGFRAHLHTPFGNLLASFCGGVLHDEQAINFVALDVDHPDHGAMVFSVHRRDGNSPIEQMKQLRAERDALNAQIAILRSIVTEAIQTTRANGSNPAAAPTG